MKKNKNKSLLPHINLSDKTKARLTVARKVLHVSYFIASWMLFVVQSTGKIKFPFPVGFLAAFGIGQMISLSVMSIVKGDYHDGFRRGLDEGSDITKGTVAPLLQMLQDRVKMLEIQLKKATHGSVQVAENPSNAQTLRRFLKQGGEKE